MTLFKHPLLEIPYIVVYKLIIHFVVFYTLHLRRFMIVLNAKSEQESGHAIQEP